ncbi:MAG: hypothetical protein H3Z54_12245 [archaeon]|nr:hypothetical protein [archaeon]
MALSLILTKLIWDLTTTLLDSISQYTDREYLNILRDKLSEVRLLYETGRISREEYKKLEIELIEQIKKVSYATYAKNRQGQIIDVRL